MLIRLVTGQYLQCNFCIPALFKPNFCDVSKYTKYKISLEELKVKIKNLNIREWGTDQSELGETHIQKVPITKSEQWQYLKEVSKSLLLMWQDMDRTS